MYERIIFIDFDGTITSEETLNEAMKMCVPPEMFKEGLGKMQSGQWTLRQAVTYAFDNISPDRMGDIMDYVKGVPIRDGFAKFLKEMKKADIPVVVISGGLKPYVEDKLKPFRDELLDVVSLDVDLSGPGIKLISPYEGETDVVEKTEVMKQYSYKTAICVGDGLTDVRMAKASDMVFARDILAQVLSKEKISFIPWKDFHDVLKGIDGGEK